LEAILFLSTVFCTFLPLTTIFALTPYLARKGTCFGVLLPEDAQKSYKIKKIKRGYAVAACLTGAVFAAVCAVFRTHHLLGIALVCYCAACLALYLACNMLVKNLVMTENWENFQKEIAARHLPQTSAKGAVSAWWYFTYVPVIGVVFYLSAGAGVKYAFALPAAQTAFGAVMFAVHLFIGKSGQYAYKRNMEKSIADNQRFRRRWSLLSLLAGLATEFTLAALQLGFLNLIQNAVILTVAPFAVTLAVTAAAILIALEHNRR
jgi:uncharacterized membrane protein